MTKSKDKGYKWLQGTTIRQQQAIDLLVQRKTDLEGADTIGVRRPELAIWHELAPQFPS